MKMRDLLLVLALIACAFGAAAAEPWVVFPINRKSVAEGDNGELTYSLEVNLIWAAESTISVTLTSSSAQATSGTDFVPVNEVVTFKAGETQKVFKFTVKGDVLTEGTEAVAIWATKKPGEIGQSMVVEIVDDDRQPNAFIRDLRVTEGGPGQSRLATFAIFPVPNGPKTDARIDYATVNGTAIAGEDYQATSGSLVIPAGSNSAAIHVPLIGDAIMEPDETFTLRISRSVNIAAGGDTTATIVNDDTPPPPFSITAKSVYEGDTGSTPTEVTVSLATASSSPVTVTVQTTGGGTATGDVDYARFSRSLTFSPGVTELTVEAMIFGDTLVEGEETFWVGVRHDGDVVASDKVRIRDDDDARPVVSIADVEVRETDDTAGRAVFQVTLSKPSSELVRVSYATVPDTASLLDFTHAAGELLFQPGQTSHTITVDVAGDRTREEKEMFRVELSDPRGLLLGDGSGVCTIIDNDDNAAKRRSARH